MTPARYSYKKFPEKCTLDQFILYCALAFSEHRLTQEYSVGIPLTACINLVPSPLTTCEKLLLLRACLCHEQNSWLDNRPGFTLVQTALYPTGKSAV
jgi:hypothetical protein